MSETVTVENGPQTEAAAAAAQTAALAAAQAVATATALGAEAASAAERAVTEISAETAEAIADQEEDLSWLREHARLSSEGLTGLRTDQEKIRGEMETFRTQTAEALNGLTTLVKSLIPQTPATETTAPETTPPVIPPEGGADGPPVPEKRRKRRLI